MMDGRVLLPISIVVLLLLPMAAASFTPASSEEIPIGGTLRVGVLHMLESLTVGHEFCWSDEGCLLNCLLYDQVAFIAPYTGGAYEWAPRLCYKWERSENGTVWTLYIAPNATWHDGTPVTAEDVAFIAMYLPRLGWWNETDTDCKKAEVIDEHTVRITLKRPWPDVPLWWLPVLPKHIWWPYRTNLTYYPNTDAIGSGPFKLKDFKPGEYIVLERYENYHGTGRKAYVNQVVIIAFGSEEARIMALKKGDIDMADDLPVVAALELNGTENIKIIVTPGDGVNWLNFNLMMEGTLGAILRDVNFRKAVAYAINKTEIVDTIYLGYATPIDSLVYAELPEHNPNLPQYECDTEKAKSILDEAGYIDTDGDGIREAPDGTPLEFKLVVAEPWTSLFKIAQVIKGDLAKVGIKIDVVVIDESTWWSYAFQPEKSPYHMTLYEEYPSPQFWWVYYMFLSMEAGGRGNNIGGYSNPEFDRIFREYEETLDPEKRKELMWKLQEIFSEDLPAITLVRPNVFGAYRTDKFEGWRYGLNGLWGWYDDWLFYSVHLKPEAVTPLSPKKPATYYWWLIGGTVAAATAATIVFLLVKKRFIKLSSQPFSSR